MAQTCNPRDAFFPNSVESGDMYQDNDDTVSLAHEAFTKSRTMSFTSSLPESSASSPSGSATSPPPEKKTTKKRKAWGQVLPTPTTNLPPRKRAKTEAEKEQRRVERIMRNRNAAQTSREKKREAYEKLENEKRDAEERAERLARDLRRIEGEKHALQNHVAMLFDRIRALEVGASASEVPHHVAAPSPSPTLAPDLLLGYDHSINTPSRPESPIQDTIDPRTSFSPSPSTMTVVAPATTPDLTQRPAEPLCVYSNDQQCQSEVVEAVPDQHRLLPFMKVLPKMFACMILSAMTWISSSCLMHPLYQIFVSLTTGQQLPIQTCLQPNLLTLINFLTSTPVNLGVRQSSLKTANPTNLFIYSATPSFQINFLQRFLACNPSLAPRTRAATVKALQRLSSSIDLRGSCPNSPEDQTATASSMGTVQESSISASEVSPRLEDGSTGRQRISFNFQGLVPIGRQTGFSRRRGSLQDGV